MSHSNLLWMINDVGNVLHLHHCLLTVLQGCWNISKTVEHFAEFSFLIGKVILRALLRISWVKFVAIYTKTMWIRILPYCVYFTRSMWVRELRRLVGALRSICSSWRNSISCTTCSQKSKPRYRSISESLHILTICKCDYSFLKHNDVFLFTLKGNVMGFWSFFLL